MSVTNLSRGQNRTRFGLPQFGRPDALCVILVGVLSVLSRSQTALGQVDWRCHSVDGTGCGEPRSPLPMAVFRWSSVNSSSILGSCSHVLRDPFSPPSSFLFSAVLQPGAALLKENDLKRL